MGLLDLFRRRSPEIETRASGSGFTAEVMAMRESWIAGRSGLGELTGTVQAAVSLWESALAAADVDGTDLLERHVLAMVGRSLALRGESIWAIVGERLVPAVDWDVRTRSSRPTAYRLSLPESGGARSVTVLAEEVLHFRVGADSSAPWAGTSPLRRARLSAELLHAVESALAEVYREAPLGTQVIPFPEAPGTDMAALAREFRGKRGRVLLRESVNVTAAGGPGPSTDWRPQDTTPDLARAMTAESLAAARDAVALAYGVLPGLANPATTGPLVREAQRHLATWALQPIAMLLAEEASEKLGAEITIDVLRPLQAFDAGGRARALSAIISAMAEAKAAGLAAEQVAEALHLVEWKDDVARR